jgi:hypothetical protein
MHCAMVESDGPDCKPLVCYQTSVFQ